MSIDMRMKQVDDHHSTKSRVRNLEDRAVSRTEVPDAHMVQKQVDKTFCGAAPEKCRRG